MGICGTWRLMRPPFLPCFVCIFYLCGICSAYNTFVGIYANETQCLITEPPRFVRHASYKGKFLTNPNELHSNVWKSDTLHDSEACDTTKISASLIAFSAVSVYVGEGFVACSSSSSSA